MNRIFINTPESVKSYITIHNLDISTTRAEVAAIMVRLLSLEEAKR